MQTRLVPLDLVFAQAEISDSAYGANSTASSGVREPPLLPLACHSHARRARLGRNVSDWLRLWRHKPVVSALSRDRLVVSGGLARCRLARACGKTWIRMLLTDEVCSQWDSRPIAKLSSIDDIRNRVFYSPVYHGKFRRAKVCRLDAVRLDRIRKLLGPLGEGLRCCDVGCNMGWMAHHMQRQGFGVTGIDYDERHLAVAWALNETYGLDVQFHNCFLAAFEPDHEFDVTLALTVLYHMFFRQDEWAIPPSARMDPPAVVSKIDSMTKHALIWESGDDPEREKDIILSHSKMTRYLALGPTKGTGKRRELGVFLRPGSEIAERLTAHYRMAFACEPWYTLTPTGALVDPRERHLR